MLEKGYIQLYTGNGKGKTTAALGLALRAAGAGLKVLILQFMKGQKYRELEALKKFSGTITVEQLGSGSFCRVGDDTYKEHQALARKGYGRAIEALKSREYGVVILDEIVTALHFGLISEDELFTLLDKKPLGVEIVLTGRGATEKLIERCDLATEMREIRHYYNDGVPARKGIES